MSNLTNDLPHLFPTHRNCLGVLFHHPRRYRACAIDSLGLGIMCTLYHCTVCTSDPNLVSFAFYQYSGLQSADHIGEVSSYATISKKDITYAEDSLFSQLHIQKCMYGSFAYKHCIY